MMAVNLRRQEKVNKLSLTINVMVAFIGYEVI